MQAGTDDGRAIANAPGARDVAGKRTATRTSVSDASLAHTLPVHALERSIDSHATAGQSHSVTNPRDAARSMESHDDAPANAANEAST
jgi:hypothetical protein